MNQRRKQPDYAEAGRESNLLRRDIAWPMKQLKNKMTEKKPLKTKAKSLNQSRLQTERFIDV